MKDVYQLPKHVDQINHGDGTGSLDVFTGGRHEGSERELEGEYVLLLHVFAPEEVAAGCELHQDQDGHDGRLDDLLRVALHRD